MPDFYHLEIKAINRGYMQRSGCESCKSLNVSGSSSSKIWSRLFVGRRRQRYRETVFISEASNAKRVLPVLQAALPCPKAHVTYRKVQPFKAYCTATNMRRQPLRFAGADGVAEYCHSSLTRVLDLMIRQAQPHSLNKAAPAR